MTNAGGGLFPSCPDEIVQAAKLLVDFDCPVVEMSSPADIGILSRLQDQKFVVALRNSNLPAWDAIKECFFELGLMGGNVAAGELPIWFGSTEPIREKKIFSKINLPLFVSYYTLGTGYEDAAARLRSTLVRYELDHELVGINSRGSWERNCAYKPGFIRDLWRQSKRPIVWLDADATVEAFPSLFFRTQADIAFHKWRDMAFSHENERFGWELASGTLLFNQTREAETLLDRWCDRCAADPMTWDQLHLDSAWADMNIIGKLKTLFLPQRYLQIFDRADIAGEGSGIIKHWQASRQFKAAVSDGIARPKHQIDESFVRARRYARFLRFPESLFWMSEGENHIKPPVSAEHPEGFDPGPFIRAFCDESLPILEIGCGVGRLAKAFEPHNYMGMDVNPSALIKAKLALPTHNFRLMTDETTIPVCGTAFLYTVALHLNDDAFVAMLDRLALAAQRIIISEIMDRRWRRSGSPPVFNREAEDIILLLGRFGFRLTCSDRRAYERYDCRPELWLRRDTRLTTLVFERS